MIHVFRARNARELKVPAGETPLLDIRDAQDLGAKLAASELSHGEQEAVQRAVASLGPHADANILLAANGTVFRIERLGPAVTPRPAALLPSDWASVERGAPVLVAHDDARWTARAVDALRFLGYSARTPDRPLLTALAAAPPLAALIPGSATTPELVACASDRTAIIALLAQDEPAPPGAHGFLRLPLRLATVAKTLDPLIRRARSGRLRLGKATPRP